ncbi:MAG: NifB/NifX family molybdenum-iron cluster-binding protein [Thermodesulfobacteriota bacterium]|nr:NifB/NifX family molybdenum-iron cluster-binding protein [Thermodesulfobacteriota bacterium]
MKIAVSAEEPYPESKVGQRFGTSKYFVIVDKETMGFESVPNPGASSISGSGVQAIVLVVSKKVDTVLTGYCSPTAMGHLTKNGIQVVTDVSGNVYEAVTKYKNNELKNITEVNHQSDAWGSGNRKAALTSAFKSSVKQFFSILPTLTGVVLLIGLLNVLMSTDLLSLFFSGNAVFDTLWGACLGSIFAGNPVNSYVIGGQMLEYGISLFAVTAVIVAWVTVGLVQIPTEISALGRKFAVIRNIVSFFMSIAIAGVTVMAFNFIGVSL